MSGINPINGTGKITYNPVFKQNPETKPANTPDVPKNVSMSGMEALASYNFANVNKNRDFDIPQLEIIDTPNDLNKVEGEKVYNSKGKLVCVTKNDEKLKTTYFANNKTEVKDAATGKLLKSQIISNLDNEKIIVVNEYKDNGTILSTAYSDKGGNIKFLNKHKVVGQSDGYQRIYSKNSWSEDYVLDEVKPSISNKTVFYDKNGNLREFIDNAKSRSKMTKVIYKNNEPFALKQEKEGLLTLVNNENILEKCKNDKDLIPAKKIYVPENARDLDGEKTYYSNGIIESNLVKDENGESLYKFDTDGKLVSMKSGNKTAEFVSDNDKINPDHVNITEEFDDGGSRETIISEGKPVFVKYSKDNTEKSINFDGDGGTIGTYTERDENGKSVCFKFDSDGNIKDMFEFEIVKNQKTE